MTDNEILEYTKRCLNFLGFKVLDNTEGECYTNTSNPFDVLHLEDFNFVNDWSWIMKVVEAIEQHNISYIMGRSIKNTFNIESDGIKIYYHPNNKYLLHLELKPYLIDGGWKHPMYKSHIIQSFDFKNKSKMEAVVQAINQFLIWYENEQTRNNNIS